ncbi:MAG: hypothetical protein KatS3mg112_1363 [Thermogutta sp.]|nr:MAG: hypothetical protein KatS3mg112_1363 [Thermogutta sp.]
MNCPYRERPHGVPTGNVFHRMSLAGVEPSPPIACASHLCSGEFLAADRAPLLLADNNRD